MALKCKVVALAAQAQGKKGRSVVGLMEEQAVCV